MKNLLVAVAGLMVMTACVGANGVDGKAGKDGLSCTVTQTDAGEAIIRCGDGSEVHVPPGQAGRDGDDCTAVDNLDGTFTVTCPDGSSFTVSDGRDGEDGAEGQAGAAAEPCTVVANQGGGSTITCPDGTQVTVADGAPGSSCGVTDNGDGTHTIACANGTSVTVSDGQAGPAGADAEPCSVASTGAGTHTITCPDGTSVVVADGAAGASGTSCSVTDNQDGTHTVACTDGSSVVLRDGLDAEPCTVVDNQDGTATVSCPDGSSAVLHDGQDGAPGTHGTSCSVVDNHDGTATIQCTDGSSATVVSGTDAQPCTVVDNGDGTHTITCPDGTSVEVSDGQDGTPGSNGTSCSVSGPVAGCSTISCTDGTSTTVCNGLMGPQGLPGGDGAPGTPGLDGEPCTVVDNGNGTHTITCPDGTSVVVSDGADGSPGINGTSCSVSGPVAGCSTISCTDGTSTTVCNGLMGPQGMPGEDGGSCSIQYDATTTATYVGCDDGSSYVLGCGTGHLLCGGACVDGTTVDNCGACGNLCESYQSCIDGGCRGDPLAEVSDNATGLMWQRCIFGATVDATCTHPTQAIDRMNRSGAGSYCANLELAGWNDWRLPNSNELFTLVDGSQGPPTIDLSLYPNTPATRFWTSSGVVASNRAYVEFATGTMNDSSDTDAYHVRCVRTEAEHMPSTVEVGASGLEWQRCSANQLNDAACTTFAWAYDRFTWYAAGSYCADLVLGGHSDWRLPTLTELGTIVDTGQGSPTIDLAVFPGTRADRYWTSTGIAPNSIYFINFLDGTTGDWDATSAAWARCVRTIN